MPTTSITVRALACRLAIVTPASVAHRAFADATARGVRDAAHARSAII